MSPIMADALSRLSRVILVENTPDALRRRRWRRANIKHWRDWATGSIAEARTVEVYFHTEIMFEGGTGGSLSFEKPVYAYMF